MSILACWHQHLAQSAAADAFGECIQTQCFYRILNSDKCLRSAWQVLTPSSPPLVPPRARQRPLLTASQTRRQWRKRYGEAAWPASATSCPPSGVSWPKPRQTPAPLASVQCFSWPGCVSPWGNSVPTWSTASWESRGAQRPRRGEHPDRARSWEKPGPPRRSAPPRPSGRVWRRSFSAAAWRPTASGAPPSPKSDTVRNVDAYMWNLIGCMPCQLRVVITPFLIAADSELRSLLFSPKRQRNSSEPLWLADLQQ